MTENGLFILGGPETQLHDILWAVHDGKNRGRSEGKEGKFQGVASYGGRSGATVLPLPQSGTTARACGTTAPRSSTTACPR